MLNNVQLMTPANKTSILESDQSTSTGLILSGGGSRAAYQVGVLRAISHLLPKDSPNPFQVIAGTSAGALNAATLASHARLFRFAVKRLEFVWKNLTSDQIYDPESGGLLSGASNVLMGMLGNKTEEKSMSLFDNSPLGELLSRVIHFDRIQHNIDVGLIDALSVTASDYNSGESVSFYQAIKGIEEWSGPHRLGKRTTLKLDHLMASSAIPVIFPAVKIDERYYGDGAVRQLAPTSTAIHLGARRLLAIGVSGNRSGTTTPELEPSAPGLLNIVGHILNSAFVDTLENDLEFLRHMNELIPHVPESSRRKISRPLHEIELLEISPSRELNTLASEYYDELPRALSRFVKEDGSGTMLSLILFEKGFCNALLELGYKDAMSKEDDIRHFFGL